MLELQLIQLTYFGVEIQGVFLKGGVLFVL